MIPRTSQPQMMLRQRVRGPKEGKGDSHAWLLNFFACEHYQHPGHILRAETDRPLGKKNQCTRADTLVDEDLLIASISLENSFL